MKVEVKNESEPKELPFPKLMYSKDDELLVLFIDYGRGILMSDERQLYRKESIHYSTDWGMSAFTDFKGSITITQ